MNFPKLLTPAGWRDYELIDSGGFEKLERFGRWVVARPEPQAIWNRSLPDTEWARADALFRREQRSDERGEWICSPGMPRQWWVEYAGGSLRFRMKLSLTAFKHLGLFPEQASNWDFLYDNLLRRATENAPQVLNLFAYTGGATLAAAAAGAQVTHLDSVKQVVGWARENALENGFENIRWIVDDALKFVRREVSRGKVYDAIVLDPPAYGRGPEGEKWVLEQNINVLLSHCGKLLKPDNSIFILNLYSMGLSALLAKGLANQLVGHAVNEEFGELLFPDRSGKALPLGIFYRMTR